ncbi:uncharacterized protein involved in exopolysaccharide biosynthesis [Amaricoccus macauensis]|uniref:non-specific protein-tyrosine kinase n=1 Tax=Amaricoccus macauensis TaxID=57001 RepID=A0A840SQK7_9RHOB|nr:AAA family ATPase [Amaricoccus macauensis]MBB5222136.1 uncharacterized protein involved in exopolysaccharide biosynthesis [Amaricoccus macauensis]
MTHFDKLSRSMIRPAPTPVQLREEELDLFSVFRLIRRRIWLILIVGAVLTALALPAILGMERPYYGQSRLLIQQPITSALGTDPNSRPAPLDPNTEIERLLARPIAVRMVQEFHLDRLEEFNPSLKPVPAFTAWVDGAKRWLKGEAEPVAPSQADIMEEVIAGYYNGLVVRRSGTTDVIEIGFSSLDPQLAADIPNALVRIYLDARDSGVRGRVSEAEAWLAPQIEAQRERLESALTEVKAFRDSSGLVSDDARSDAARTISVLTARQAELSTESADAAAALASLQARRGTPEAAQAVDTEAMAGLRRSLQQQQSQLQRLLEVYGENYGPVLDARSSIRETQSAIVGEVDRTIQALQAKLASFDRESVANASGLDEARGRLTRLNGSQNQLAALTSTVDREQKALDLLEDQRRELSRRSDVPVAEAEILSPASVPLEPAGRGKLIYLIGAMVAAGSIALTVALVCEMLDTGLRSPQQLARLPGVMSGGLVPALGKDEVEDLRETLRRRRGGMFAEAARGLIHSLERSNDGVLPESILVTSALPGEGKSTLSLALALELAAGGRKVLLVDTDLRQGHLAETFGVGGASGLLDLIAGDVTAEEIIRHDPVSRVDFVTRGSAEAFGALREPRQLAALLRVAKARGAVVIFDSAPVLATTETAILAGVAERSLLVLRWGKTPRRAADLAVAEIGAQTSGPILATMNAVDLARHAQYGYHDAGMFAGRLAKYYPGGR